jgi:hypothetical protein
LWADLAVNGLERFIKFLKIYQVLEVWIVLKPNDCPIFMLLNKLGHLKMAE